MEALSKQVFLALIVVAIGCDLGGDPPVPGQGIGVGTQNLPPCNSTLAQPNTPATELPDPDVLFPGDIDIVTQASRPQQPVPQQQQQPGITPPGPVPQQPGIGQLPDGRFCRL